MERQQESELVTARHQLLTLERNRLHPHRHNLFWHGTQWQATLARVIECEQRRDAQYLHFIASVPVGSADGLASLQALYDEIEHDLSWYQWLVAEVQAKQEQTAGPSISQQAQHELMVHHGLIITWLRNRDVRLNQIALEYLEGRRREQGRLSNGVWQSYWTRLQQATQLQSEDWQQSYAQTFPQLDIAERLEWYKQLREIQEHTRQLWRGERGFDSRSWKQDWTAVSTAIRVIEPRRQLFSAWLALVVAGVAALLFTSTLPSAEPRPANALISSNIPATTARSASEVNEQGLSLMVQGDCAAAMPLFQQAAQLDPAFYQPPNNLAFCLFDQGDVPAAITYWRRSVALNAENADGHAGLGTALFSSGFIAEGQAEYQTALKLNPKYSDELWLRNVAKWSDHAIAASGPLRLQAGR